MLNKIQTKLRKVVMAFVKADAANGTIKNQAVNVEKDKSPTIVIAISSGKVKSEFDVDHDQDGNRLSRAIYMDDATAFKSLVEDNPSFAQHYTIHRIGKNDLKACSTLNYIVECGRGGQDVLKSTQEMISFALDCGADINARAPDDRWNPSGWTPLETAIYSDRYLLIPFLIQNGARPIHGQRADALTDDAKMLWAFFRQTVGCSTCTDSELVNIVDAFASIGLVKSGFELTGCEALDTQEMMSIAQNCRKSFMDLIAQVDAAKAKKEKEILLRELAIPSEHIEVRPKRRM